MINSTNIIVGFTNGGRNDLFAMYSLSLNSSNDLTYTSSTMPVSSTPYVYERVRHSHSEPRHFIITYDRKVCFSYRTNLHNEYIMGMCDMPTIERLRVRPMYYKIASTSSGEQLEISSVYANGFALSSGTGYFSLCIDNNDDELITIGYLDNNDYTKKIQLSNCPIILKENQALYASWGAWSNDNYSYRGTNTFTVFGLKRT